MADFSHLTDANQAAMVDVADKLETTREASATCSVLVSPETRSLLNSAQVDEICTVARIAGIQAAKKTSELIPMCHPIALTKADVQITFDTEQCRFYVNSRTKCVGVTGVEMEALVASSISANTIYDMIKAVDPAATIENQKVLTKSGGKLGIWKHPQP